MARKPSPEGELSTDEMPAITTADLPSDPSQVLIYSKSDFDRAVDVFKKEWLLEAELRGHAMEFATRAYQNRELNGTTLIDHANHVLRFLKGA